MKTLKQWQFIKNEKNRIDLACDHGFILHIFVLENDIIRVAFTRNSEFKLPHTWAITPNKKDVEWKGRDKWSLDGFSLPNYQLIQTEKTLEISTALLRLTVHQPLYLEWEFKQGEKWKPLMMDRKTGAYLMGISNSDISHLGTWYLLNY